MPISDNGLITAKKEPDPKTLLADMKKEVRAVIDKYANTALSLAKSSDPHTPIIAAMQIALSNAAAEYLIVCGLHPVEATQATINVTGLGMKTWIETVMRQHKLHAKVTTDTVEIKDGQKPTVN